ncbi:hypothetical protein CYMTET_21827 [Cymbomonas tetramitiformis]|uniref:Uncharacterized protein n=1 Tax=Cymbomonas tetramitiformis TaxID=36881 RepID=A0AAE0G232_9CHLO|nr:hypothetical protein CYMTET_21827 [Cymbomonas tetramitiformis]
MGDAWYSGTVGLTSAEGPTHIFYDEGDQEHLNMDKAKYEVFPDGPGGVDAGSSLRGQDSGQLLAKGRGASRAVKGMSSLQVQAAEEQGEERTVWTRLLVRHVSAVLPAGVASGGMRVISVVLRKEKGRRHALAPVVLHKEKGRRHVRHLCWSSTRRRAGGMCVISVVLHKQGEGYGMRRHSVVLHKEKGRRHKGHLGGPP